MTRLDKIVVAVLFVIVAVLVAGRQSVLHGPDVGRRPALPEQALPETMPVLPDRVRRPPLLDPGRRDPVIPVQADNPRTGALLLGTAFSVDPRGVWLTARHVASSVCAQVIMVVDGRPLPAEIAYIHPQADIAVLRTAAGSPALPFSSDGLTIDQTGFSFGYPTGVLGATRDELMGRSRMLLSGRQGGITPTLTWAETRRFPDTLETLGGMSGGPMLDEHGRVIGVVVAATSRRGRIHTVAPELLQQVQHETALFTSSPRQVPPQDIADRPEALSAVATALNQKSRIARVYCRVD